MALAACLAGTLAYMFFPSANGERPLRPSSISGTTTAKAGPGEQWDARNIADGKTSTAWAGQASVQGEKDYVLFAFRRPTALTRLVLYNGALTNGLVDRRFNRARTVDVAISDGSHSQWNLRDDGSGQMWVLPTTPTELLRVTILDVYPGTERNITPISEIELWGMK
jgi:hypothetical protein